MTNNEATRFLILSSDPPHPGNILSTVLLFFPTKLPESGVFVFSCYLHDLFSHSLPLRTLQSGFHFKNINTILCEVISNLHVAKSRDYFSFCPLATHPLVFLLLCGLSLSSSESLFPMLLKPY